MAICCKVDLLWTLVFIGMPPQEKKRRTWERGSCQLGSGSAGEVGGRMPMVGVDAKGCFRMCRPGQERGRTMEGVAASAPLLVLPAAVFAALRVLLASSSRSRVKESCEIGLSQIYIFLKKLVNERAFGLATFVLLFFKLNWGASGKGGSGGGTFDISTNAVATISRTGDIEASRLPL